jgi:LysM domain
MLSHRIKLKNVLLGMTQQMKRILLIVFGLLILFVPIGHTEEVPAPLTKPEVTPRSEPLAKEPLAKEPPSASAPAPAPAKILDKEMDYIVKKGDTLWDISKRFYNDAFLWPRLWQQNQYITNPHQISPGDRIRLYPYKVLIEEEAKPPTVEEVKPPAPTVEEAAPPLPPPPAIIRLTVFPEVNSAGFITDKMEGIGKIVAAKADKVHLCKEDEIYISFQKGITVKKGDQFTIFRVGDPIVHPIIGKRVLGRKVQILGQAVITKTTEGRAQAALITQSYEFIVTGDGVSPYFALPEELAVNTMKQPLYGWIVAGKNDQMEYVEGEVVYIDLGEEDHVRPGDILQVIRRGAVVPDPVSKEKKAVVKLPDENIGRLVVIKTQPRTSTAVIVQIRIAVRVGDGVATVAE